MKSIAIIYGSSTENTKDAAEKIAAELSDFNPTVKEVSEASADDFTNNDILILGCSTWGLGDLQDDWETYISDFKKLDLAGKTVAIFGTGDSSGYADTFCDAIGVIYEELEGKGCNVIGEVETSDYSFDESKAVVDGKFIGLPLDYDNESDQTEERISSWVESLKAKF